MVAIAKLAQCERWGISHVKTLKARDSFFIIVDFLPWSQVIV